MTTDPAFENVWRDLAAGNIVASSVPRPKRRRLALKDGIVAEVSSDDTPAANPLKAVRTITRHDCDDGTVEIDIIDEEVAPAPAAASEPALQPASDAFATAMGDPWRTR